MSKLNVALIGCGQRGPAHAKAAQNCDRMELIAVCDLDQERATAAAEQFGVPAFTDSKELLAKDDLDAVLISTHTRHHTAVTLDAIAAGKHFIIEKPFTDTVAAAKEIIERAKTNNVIGTIGYQQRFMTYTEVLKEQVGDIDLVQICWTRQRGFMNPQYFFPESYGGVMDTVSHDIDLVLWLAEWNPVAVYADVQRGSFKGDQTIEFVSAVIEFEQDGKRRVANLSGSLAADQIQNINQLIGRRGTICAVDKATVNIVKHDGFNEDKTCRNKQAEAIAVPKQPMDPLLRLYGNFADAVLDGAELRVTLEHGMKAVAVCEAIAESGDKRQRVAIDL
ncbi:MAG: Gfo/Idh/MocA family oxidoreductase [Planctomycetes bacterium]|nr:Gfo/Idh/MocA family oxidoreductase [Planctomycetota bacterium]